MPKLPPLTRVSDIRLSRNPVLEAWTYHFLTENNIEHLLNPSIVASPEQLNFMVALQDDQLYVPCDDQTFFRIYGRRSKELAAEYLNCWRFVVGLVQSYKMDKPDAGRILTLCRYRFRLFFAERTILPSRMIKRLVNVVLTQSGDPDPFSSKKRASNAQAQAWLENPQFQDILQKCPTFSKDCTDISQMRRELDIAEMSRLMKLSTLEALWNGKATLKDFAEEAQGAEQNCQCLRTVFHENDEERKKILFIPDVAGGFMLDVCLLNALLRQGHQVVLVLKDAFYFNSPTIWDLEGESLIKAALEKAHVCNDDALTKNELLQLLREYQFVIISDGTSEQLNLYRTNVSFARAWKECDVVIAKGRRNSQVLIGSSHEFTRDILAYWRDEGGTFHCTLKTRASWVSKFAEQDILEQSKGIIRQMRLAREAGKTVMFYSAIIGSIPGQTKTAIQLVNTFVAYLRDKLDNTFIINPAEHFEQGMDGDDLMYMWEHVQRSGYLDVWRFQTVEDIEMSFSLLKSKVPSLWSGKDSTFSTGCTKEMLIALDVQKQHPELQIIGPSADKFLRRREYGVGKYFDATLKH